MKTAVVGVGALGQHHARIHSELPQADLAALVDIDQQRAREVAHSCGCPFLFDYREILDPQRVQAVSLAVPTEEHCRLACDFLRLGIHVLVEKPIASNLKEAQQMLEAQREGGARLQVGHSERFNPAWMAARPHIKNPGFFEVHRMASFVPRSLDIDVVLDLMIHDLDLILQVAGSPLKEIRAVGIPVLTPREDIANVRLEFESGCVANLTASRISASRVRKLRLFQPHDYISVDFQKRDVQMYSLARGGDSFNIVRGDLQIGDQEPLRCEIEQFLEDGPLACSGEDGFRVLALATEIKQAIAGQKIQG